MTKWKRLKKRRERKRTEEAKKSSEHEEKFPRLPDEARNVIEDISGNTQQSQKTEKLGSTKTSKPTTILAQIPRYVYLLAIFALLSGVFFPLITPGVPYDYVIQGTATLFLGLVGGILLFKTTTSDDRRGILIVIGFVLIAICLALIYHLQQVFRSLYF